MRLLFLLILLNNFVFILATKSEIQLKNIAAKNKKLEEDKIKKQERNDS